MSSNMSTGRSPAADRMSLPLLCVEQMNRPSQVDGSICLIWSSSRWLSYMEICTTKRFLSAVSTLDMAFAIFA